jgi:hypothetical protein
VIELKLESWTALAPGIDDVEDWCSWLRHENGEKPVEPSLPNLGEIPPLLRRRFSTLAKYAARAALDQKLAHQHLSTVYASRHGDTPLTLSLLEDIGRDQPLSPTSFSLAVHNAVGGLLSIAQQDQSPMTAIASKQNLVLSTLHEAIAQLQVYPRVLCVIYDVPLPEIYRPYSDSLPFPVAVSFVLARRDGEGIPFRLEHKSEPVAEISSEQGMLDFIALLSGVKQQLILPHRNQHWLLSGAGNA